MNWDVKIKATVTKIISVEADNEEEAVELANELFTVQCEGINENYNEEIISVSGDGIVAEDKYTCSLPSKSLMIDF